MATKTAKSVKTGNKGTSTPAAEVAPVDGELVNQETGEVTSALAPRRGEVLANVEIADPTAALAALDALEEVDESDLEKPAQELVKLEKGESLKGLYMGLHQDTKSLKAHFFATRHPQTGEPIVQKIRASAALNTQMKTVKEGTPCVVKFIEMRQDGTFTDENGETKPRFMNFWDVRVLKQK